MRRESDLAFLFNHLKDHWTKVYEHTFVNNQLGQLPLDQKSGQTGNFKTRITVQGYTNGSLLKINVLTSADYFVPDAESADVVIKATLTLDTKQIELYAKPHYLTYYSTPNNCFNGECFFKPISMKQFHNISLDILSSWSVKVAGSYMRPYTFATLMTTPMANPINRVIFKK